MSLIEKLVTRKIRSTCGKGYSTIRGAFLRSFDDLLKVASSLVEIGRYSPACEIFTSIITLLDTFFKCVLGLYSGKYRSVA